MQGLMDIISLSQQDGSELLLSTIIFLVPIIQCHVYNVCWINQKMMFLK